MDRVQTVYVPTCEIRSNNNCHGILHNKSSIRTILWTRPMGNMIHMNWGWHGSGNGWFNKGAVSFQPKNYSVAYGNLQYVIIRK